ncbi:MAG: PaaI family thioesterase [Actinomycetota bacterium]
MNDTERTPLPSHTPRCFGCGPENPCGLGLHAWRDGDEVRGHVVFAEHHSGAAGFAPGGGVAPALDDCLGFLLYVIGQPAVTAKLEVNYRKPVTVTTEYTLHAWLNSREGRKLYASVDMRNVEGEIVAEGTGLFVTVSLEHFTKNLPEDWREQARKRGLNLPW